MNISELAATLQFERDSNHGDMLTFAQIEKARAFVADEVRKRTAELEAALAPFARMADSYDDQPAAHVVASRGGTILGVYDLRAAKAALQKPE